jgi:RNA polymerase sigma factor (sigma-70 family)
VRDSERESLYHDAYAVLLEKHRSGALDMEAMHPTQVRSYLITAAVHVALHEHRRAENRRTTPLEELGSDLVDQEVPPEERAASEAEAADIRGLVKELPERRRLVVQLRFLFDRTPAEIQNLLRISQRTYRKELERGLRQIGRSYGLFRQGRWCEERRGALLAYAAGTAGERTAKEAALHIGACPGCARLVAELRGAAERTAALLSLPDVVRNDGPIHRLAEAASGAKAQLADLATTGNQHAIGLIARGDPSAPQYAAGVRPGAVTAAVMGCLVLRGTKNFGRTISPQA